VTCPTMLMRGKRRSASMFYTETNIIRVIKSRRLKWAGRIVPCVDIQATEENESHYER